MAEQLYTTPGSTSWTCPDNVYTVKVECWGAGGYGQDGGGTPKGGANTSGGGGGGYSAVNNLVVIPGTSYNLYVAAANEDSYFKDTSTVLAKGGTVGSGNTPQPGGQASAGVGDIKYSGGTSSNDQGPDGAGGGGGGAAGPHGNGQDAWWSGLPGGYGGAGDAGFGGTGGLPAASNGGDSELGGGGGGGSANNGGGYNGGAPGGGGGGGEDYGGYGARGQVKLTYFETPRGGSFIFNLI